MLHMDGLKSPESILIISNLYSGSKTEDFVDQKSENIHICKMATYPWPGDFRQVHISAGMWDVFIYLYREQEAVTALLQIVSKLSHVGG